MSLITKIRDAAARTAAAGRRCAAMFILGGPVGLYYAARLALNKRNLARTAVFVQRERDMHREHLAALGQETKNLVAQQQALNIASADFWKWCEGRAGVGQ